MPITCKGRLDGGLRPISGLRKPPNVDFILAHGTHFGQQNFLERFLEGQNCPGS
jgi:hypothetical protein